MNTSPEELEKRLSQLKKAVPSRGLARHPSRLRQLSELPLELQFSSINGTFSGEQIKEIITFPAQIHRGNHYVPRQALLFTPSGVIHLLASIWPEQDPTITFMGNNGLMFMKVTLILLYGYLEIVAQGKESPIRLEVEFNTVAWELISRPIRQMLVTGKHQPGEATGGISLSQRSDWAFGKLPLKFFNGARIYGLLPGEELEEMVFQPNVWERRLVLFRKNIIANTLLMLTSNYMVIIQEELNVSQGWIITYIPRKSILGIQKQSHIEWDELIVNLMVAGQTSTCTIRLTNEIALDWQKCWIKHAGQWLDLPFPLSQS